jgi:hypothetical protein
MSKKIRKPRRWWLRLSYGIVVDIYRTREAARYYGGFSKDKIVQVEEVLPKPRKKVKR